MTVGINGSEEINNVALTVVTKQIFQNKLYFPCAFLYVINMHTYHMATDIPIMRQKCVFIRILQHFNGFTGSQQRLH